MGFITRTRIKYELVTQDRKAFEKDLKAIGYKVLRGEVITAMSFHKKDAMEKLVNLALPITEHLMKLLVLPKSSDAPHWKTELSGWQGELRRYNNGKTKSGVNYSQKSLMNHLWEDPIGTSADHSTLLRIIADKGYAVPKNLSEDQVKKLKKMVESFALAIFK